MRDIDGSGSRRALAVLVFLAVTAGVVVAATTDLTTPVSQNSDGVVLNNPDGATANLTGDFTAINSSGTFGSKGVSWNTTTANATFVANASASATVHVDDLTGTWTNVSGLSVAAADLRINPEDKLPINVSGGATALHYRSMQVDDGSVDFYIDGSGSATVTARGVVSSTTIAAIDADSSAVLGVSTSDASGTIDLPLSLSAHSVELQTSDGGPTADNGSPDATTVYTSDPTLQIDVSDPDFPDDNVTLDWELDGSVVDTVTATSNGTYDVTVSGLSEGSHDWNVTATDAYGQVSTSATYTFTVDHYDPQLSNPQPSGDLTNEPDTLSVDLSDADFGGDGDSVDVTFTLDGSTVDTVTATSNDTVSVSIPSQGKTGGSHSWSADATDSYGGTDSTSASYNVPSNLTIYNESAPSQVLDSTSIEATFYFENGTQHEAVTRTTSNGVINLTGLPADKPLIVNAQASDYRDRRIFVESLFDQQKVYLLPENETFTQTTFELRDYTGRFPQDTTVLVVSRALNGTYEPVLGDFFGANGQFPAELAYNERHRLTLLNIETGATRPLGTYTPLTSGEQTVAVSASGQVDVVDVDASFDVQPTAERLPAQNLTMAFTLSSGDQNVTSYDLTVTKVYNGTNTTLVSEQRDDAGTIERDLDLTGAGGGQLVVETTYEVDGQAVGERTKTYDIVSHGNGGTTILGSLSALVGQLPSGDQSAFTSAVAIVVTLMSAGAVASRLRVSSTTVGLVAVGWLTGFGILGWVGYDLVFVAIVAYVSLAALGRVIR